ncbi:AimR family lysis-lysogeny pheromone receptor [Cytobacillus sp. IB215316]|uniref:AimR family lysis-lysogeny pheromone receptor n=1 Tax=Cytobacillus sp. IB215316 TaxID=3097354 RepID=UPI002A10F290|nr:AimR family lysis-lysogeny pheromone receptor [Cytobacillus sp. IB215316]MDX8360335.1 AimR family lysis-lysogeny pheromone receptor [Cytobacillus sp. IB215316]
MITLENLYDKMIFDERSNVELGAAIKVSDKTIANMKNYLKNRSQNEPKLENILALARLYANNPTNIDAIVQDFGKNDIGATNLLKLMDYAYDNSLFDFLTDLIKRCKGKSQNLQKTAKLYDLLRIKKTQNKKWTSIILEAKLVRSSDPVIVYLLSIIDSLVVLEARNFSELELKSELSIRLAEKVKNDYLRQSFTIRALTSLMRAKMQLLKYEEVEKISKVIFNSTAGERIKASAYFSLALTKFFSDYDGCEENLKKSSYLYGRSGRIKDSQAVDSHLFIAKCYHKVDLENATGDTSDFDRAYYYYQKGLIKESEQLIKHATYEDFEAPFISFMKGLIASDLSSKRDHLRQSIILFEAIGDMHYAQLPMLELKQLDKEVPIN